MKHTVTRLLLRHTRFQTVCALTLGLFTGAAPPERSVAEEAAPTAGKDVAKVDGAVDKPLSLQESIDLALKNNPRLMAAERQKRAAQRKIPQAEAQFGPNVSLTATHTEQGPVVTFTTPGGPVTVFPSSRNDVGLTLNQTLYAGKSIPATKRIAVLGAQSAEDNFASVSQDVVFQTKATYLQVLRALALREVANDNVKSAQEHLRVARANFDAGTVPRFDVLRSEVELADAQQNLVTAENGVALAQAAFNNALGRDLATPVALQPVSNADIRTPDLETSVQRALLHRPEMLSAEKGLRVAKENVKLQQAGREPALNLNAAYHRQTSTGFSSDYSWNAALALSLPVFDRGLAKAKVREAAEEVEQNKSLLDQLRQSISLEVRQSVLNVREAKQRIDTTAKALETAEESMRIADVRYREGVGTQLEATDARVALNRARTNYTQAVYDFRTAYAAWEKAVGAGPR